LNDKLIKEEIYIRPGYICLPKKPTKLFAVVGAGVAITIFDTRLRFGGMNHYIRPIRENPSKSTPVYACPAIIGLIEMFLKHGSKIADLEAHVYGGASNPSAEDYIEGVSEKNIKVGLEILEHKKINITGKDIGGDRGRKVVFNTSTGESIVAKVDKIRSKDWYPEIKDLETNSFNF
jgi:chemotaxis protein CheD